MGAVRIKRLVCCLLSLFTVVLCCARNVNASAPRDLPSVSASCAVVVEMNTGRIIAGKNENHRASMASTTKIMTALILCERCDLDKTAVVTENMVKVEGSSMGLLPGDTVHYRDLLYGMMLASGNDAATATAILIGGSLESFARIMNERARQIGMDSTNFVTPSGLDDENHYTTAADMAKLAVTALKNEEFAKAVSSKSARLEYGNPPYPRTLTNHNKMLSYFDGCNGVKTGFTKKSGRCLVSSASRNGAGVVAVTLNAPNDWNDHKTMLEFGLGALSTREITPPELPEIKVAGNRGKTLSLTAASVNLSLLPEDFERLEVKVKLPSAVFAPIEKNEAIGKVEYSVNGDIVATSDIVSTESMVSNVTATDKNFSYWFKVLIGTK